MAVIRATSPEKEARQGRDHNCPMLAEVLKEWQRSLNQFFLSGVLTHPHRARQMITVPIFDRERHGAVLLAPSVDTVSEEVEYHSSITRDVSGVDGG